MNTPLLQGTGGSGESPTLDIADIQYIKKAIEIKQLELSFGAIEILKNLDLDVYEGEFLVLLGSSGCGKSTLLNCIAGLLEITDGQIFYRLQERCLGRAL